VVTFLPDYAASGSIRATTLPPFAKGGNILWLVPKLQLGNPYITSSYLAVLREAVIPAGIAGIQNTGR